MIGPPAICMNVWPLPNVWFCLTHCIWMSHNLHGYRCLLSKKNFDLKNIEYPDNERCLHKNMPFPTHEVNSFWYDFTRQEGILYVKRLLIDISTEIHKKPTQNKPLSSFRCNITIDRHAECVCYCDLGQPLVTARVQTRSQTGHTFTIQITQPCVPDWECAWGTRITP